MLIENSRAALIDFFAAGSGAQMIFEIGYNAANLRPARMVFCDRPNLSRKVSQIAIYNG